MLTACPLCGKEMEVGNLQIHSPSSCRMLWQKEASVWKAGEVLDWSIWLPSNFKALRCKGCMLVVFRYGETEPSSSIPAPSDLDDTWRGTSPGD